LRSLRRWRGDQRALKLLSGVGFRGQCSPPGWL